MLGWWWAAFVIKLVVGRITSKMGSNGASIADADLTALMLDAGAQFMAAGLTWYVIGQAAQFEEKLGQPAPIPAWLGRADQSDYALEEGY